MAKRTRLHIEQLDDRCLPSFSPATSFPVGPNPQAVAAADINNDGRLDLVTSNPGDNTISVLLGDGQGGFGPAADFDAYPTELVVDSASLAVADFNEDGNLDVVTVQFGYDPEFWLESATSFLLGNGDGTFQPANFIGGGALAVAAGDFNADGNMDLVFSADDYNSFGYLQMYLGNGRGGFTYPASRWTSSPMDALTVGDVNGDGKLDAVALYGTGWVFPGKGDGTFSPDNPFDSWIYNFSTTPGAQQMALGDYTGNGTLDVIVAGDSIAVHRGHGDGHFDDPINHSANGNLHTDVATADFDDDGRLDAVTSDADTGTISALLGNGDGTLQYAGAFTTGAAPAAVAVGDFNGDGRLDVAAANAGSHTVSVLLNDGAWDGPPPPPPSPPPPPPPPLIYLSAMTTAEGNTGMQPATFTVKLSHASSVDVTVDYETEDGATAAGSDYLATSGTLTFAPGEVSKTFAVQIIGDRLAEPNETIFVNLSNAKNATIVTNVDGHGVCTILDDEPRISIGDVSKSEGRKGKTTLFTFTVTLSAAYDQPVTMSFQTVNGTATTGDSDYIAKTGTLTFAPGETTKTITIEVKGDSKREANETFYLDLVGNSSNSLFTKNRGLGTIPNDD